MNKNHHAANEQQINQGKTSGSFEQYLTLIAVYHRRALKTAVEPAEKPFFLAVVFFADRLEDGGAECRGKDQGHQHRKHHGGDDGQRKLAVNRAVDPPKKALGHKDRGKDQGNADQGAVI